MMKKFYMKLVSNSRTNSMTENYFNLIKGLLSTNASDFNISLNILIYFHTKK